MKKYEYTDDMSEISGMGGGYETACRDMVVAGLEWMDTHPKAAPRFHDFEDVYGLISEDNEDAKALSDAMVAVADGCSGAMHQATVGHVLWIRGNSWEEYCKQKRKQFKEELLTEPGHGYTEPA